MKRGYCNWAVLLLFLTKVGFYTVSIVANFCAILDSMAFFISSLPGRLAWCDR